MVAFLMKKFASLITLAFTLSLALSPWSNPLVSAFTFQTDDFQLAPNGALIHRDCFHPFDSTNPIVHIRTLSVTHTDEVTFADGSIKNLPPCLYSSKSNNLKSLTSSPVSSSSPPSLQYYSNWVAYAGYTHPTDDLDLMSSIWSVPAAPPSPGLITTVFYFNGIQQHLHNTTAIFQPVLQFGFSGCGGGLAWSMTAYVVSESGRAYCGQMISVKEGDVVRGNMSRTTPITPTPSPTGDAWTITAEVLSQPNAPVSTISSTSPYPMRFACLVLEAIRMYACNEYPGTSPVVFRQNHLQASGQELLNLPWNITINHNECGQKVVIGDGATPDVAIYVDSQQ